VKVFARKQHHLSIIPATKAKQANSEFAVSSSALRDSFHGWLDSVAPTLSSSSVSSSTSPRIPRLTMLDIMRVNHATIREGESHCIWPPFVLERIKATKVITEKKAQHYEPKDANVRKLS
jgi:hypothetical protein